MHASDNQLIGVGLYTIAEAARLTRIPSPSIRRWIAGYRYHRDRKTIQLEPVCDWDVPMADSAAGLSFLDLMEIRFIHAFRQSGISLQAIRRAAFVAQDLYRHDHPFSRKKFSTDGHRIFAEIAEETGETRLLDLVRSQYAFHQVVSPSLYKSLEFGQDDEVCFWFPEWPKRKIVVDPKRAFGRPIITSVGVPTETLARAANAEGSLDRVARWFDVPIAAVQSAVEFERALAS